MPCPLNDPARGELAPNQGLTQIAREPVEGVGPSVAVDLEPRLGAEDAEPQRHLCCFALVRERQIGERLDVVRVRRIPGEREREPLGWVHCAEDAVEGERVALGRLHLDPVRLARDRAPVGARDREPLRAPPLCELLAVPEGSEDDLARRGQGVRQLENELVRAHPASLKPPRYLMTAIVSPVEIAAPSEMPSSSTVPPAGAVISFSIFIASITQISAPAST